MYEDFFQDFLSSPDTLRIYDKGRLVFSSTKDRLTPLMEYVETDAAKHQQVTILDKIMGNAAALLSVKANCREVFSPLGSELAIQTLDKFRIKHRLLKVVPHITRPDGSDWCPMEKLSLGKTPEEFYQALKKMASAKTRC
jgi:hypothetical protein